MSTTIVLLVLSIFLIFLNALFVAIEFALIAARRTRLEAEAANGNKRAGAAVKLMQTLPESLGGAQVGITLVSLALGYLAEPAVAHLLEDLFHNIGVPQSIEHTLAFIIAISIVVFLHTVVGEMVPKNLALVHGEKVALWLAPLHRAFLFVFRPFVWLVNALADLGLRLFGVKTVDELATAHTAREFVTMVDASRGEGHIDDFEHRLLSGVLVFRDRAVAEVAVPWASTVRLERNAPVSEFIDVAAVSGHSRLPVVTGGGSDQIVGFVHVKDLLYLPEDAQDSPPPRDVLRRMVAVRSDQSLEQLLFSMQRNQIHFAVLRDATNFTLGIVTLEDVLEALVGDIIDESDRAGSFAASPQA